MQEVSKEWVLNVADQFGWFIATQLAFNLIFLVMLVWIVRRMFTQSDKERESDKISSDRLLEVMVNGAEKSSASAHTLNNLTQSITGLANIIVGFKKDIAGLREFILERFK